MRFSKLAGISLAVVVPVTGVAQSIDELGGWGRLVDSGFGRALDLKLVLFAGLVVLGARSHASASALFGPGRGGGPRPAAAGVGAELGLAAGVLAAAALLGQLAPGAPGGRPGRTVSRAGPGGERRRLGHDGQVTLTVTPGRPPAPTGSAPPWPTSTAAASCPPSGSS